MRTIGAALGAHIAGRDTTLTTLLRLTRQDGATFGFTSHDEDLTVDGVLHVSSFGFDPSAQEWGDDLSPSNLELTALLDGDVLKRTDIEAGLWDYAVITIYLCNYADTSQGSLPMMTGRTGQVEFRRGVAKTELRGLAQLMSQNIIELYSPTCRAKFGDARCTVDLAPLTFAGAVTSVTSKRVFTDTGLTQTGPTLDYSSGSYQIPAVGPYTLTPVVPEGGTWQTDGGVFYWDTGTALTYVAGAPAAGQYHVAAGVYTFHSSDASKAVRFAFGYAQGYFTYGTLIWTSGDNEGYSQDVWRFSAGQVTLMVPMTYAIQAGDTFSIVAGCDRLFQTCKDRYNNVLNFRGEPDVPGIDAITSSQSTR